jgi:ribose transport system ATP-binding protein
VSMEFAPGEIHALIGENGAGKSTLIKIITGVHRPDSGAVKLDGKPVEFGSPRDALAAGIAAVHQERNLIPHFSVGENILLERLPTRNGFVDYESINARAREVLDLLDPGIDVRTEVISLSVAQMQLVEIAKALSLNARVLLLDEPTASITNHEAAALFAVLRRLKAAGVAIVFVSHKLDEVMALCDRVTVLRDGHIAASNEPIAQMPRPRLVSMMIGREERIAQIAHGSGVIGDVALELRGVATSYGHRRIDSHCARPRYSASTDLSEPDVRSLRGRSSERPRSPAARFLCVVGARQSTVRTRLSPAIALGMSVKTERARG